MCALFGLEPALDVYWNIISVTFIIFNLLVHNCTSEDFIWCAVIHYLTDKFFIELCGIVSHELPALSDTDIWNQSALRWWSRDIFRSLNILNSSSYFMTSKIAFYHHR